MESSERVDSVKTWTCIIRPTQKILLVSNVKDFYSGRPTVPFWELWKTWRTGGFYANIIPRRIREIEMSKFHRNKKKKSNKGSQQIIVILVIAAVLTIAILTSIS